MQKASSNVKKIIFKAAKECAAEIEPSSRRSLEESAEKMKIAISAQTALGDVQQTHTSVPSDDVPIPKKETLAVALYDFHPSEPGEVGFFKGEVICVLAEIHPDWWKGRVMSGSGGAFGRAAERIGLFPSNYVRKMPDENLEQQSAAEDPYKLASVERLLSMIATFNPQAESPAENIELQRLHNDAFQAKPKILCKLDQIKQKKVATITFQGKLQQALLKCEALGLF